MSHDSRRELYEIFRLNYTKLNIILKKDGAYNGEKCSKDEPTANSEQATTHPCGRTNEPTNVTRTNLQRTSRMHDQFEANSTRAQRNSRQRTRVAVNKIHVACVWRAMCVCVWGCCVRFGSFGGRCVWMCARSVVFGSQRVGHWREHRTCVCDCVWFDIKPKPAKVPTNRSEGHTKTRMLYTNQINIDLHIGYKSNLIAI